MAPAAKKSTAQARPDIRGVLAANVISLRAQRGWTQEALAIESGLHRTFVAHVERQVRNISLESLEKLATAFEVQTYALLVPTKA